MAIEVEREAPQITSLYRHFNSEGELLYVGISLNAINRLCQHRASSWTLDITQVTIEHFSNRNQAMIAEREAVIKEEPIHNVQLREKPDTKWSSWRKHFKASLDFLEDNVVGIDAIYDMNGMATLLKTGKSNIRRLVEIGDLQGVKIERWRSLKDPKPTDTWFTGWQVLDYLERLSRRGSQ